ncbi:polysaccharide deacetylase family protein [Paenibacillus sp. GCM10027626]|uniref:polysaccharide deacetylase family protein n=1 Tax=Paenibacillus sp. GCM10027626 TaxID=3273411 RepID=UPI0036350D0B
MSKQRKMSKERKKRRRRLLLLVAVVVVVALVAGCTSKGWFGGSSDGNLSGSGQGTAGLSGPKDGDKNNDSGQTSTNQNGTEEPGSNNGSGNGDAENGEPSLQSGNEEEGSKGGESGATDEGSKETGSTNDNGSAEQPGTAEPQKEDPTNVDDPGNITQTGKGTSGSTTALAKPTAPKSDFVMAPDQKLVALTFDDGPDENYTPAILDILKENDVKATFFLVGTQVKKYPKMVQRILDEGHAIGNHSYDHADLSKLNEKGVTKEIKQADDLIEKAVGFVPHLVRAPYGALSKTVKAVMSNNGREHIGWTVDTRDWAGESVDKMLKNIKTNTKSGGIILMHSFGGKNIKNTVSLVPKAIKELRDSGYTFVTVDELNAAKAHEKEAKNKTTVKK